MSFLRTATPMADWRSFKFTVDESAGVVGMKEVAEDALDGIYTQSFLYLIQDMVVAVLRSADDGDEVVGIYHAEKIVVPKLTESTDVFLPGDRVYWDPTTRMVTPTYNSGYYWIGIATEPADADDHGVEIDLKGERAEVEAAL